MRTTRQWTYEGHGSRQPTSYVSVGGILDRVQLASSSCDARTRRSDPGHWSRLRRVVRPCVLPWRLPDKEGDQRLSEGPVGQVLAADPPAVRGDVVVREAVSGVRVFSAAYGVGVWGDTSPRNGCCARAAG